MERKLKALPVQQVRAEDITKKLRRMAKERPKKSSRNPLERFWEEWEKRGVASSEPSEDDEISSTKNR